MKELSVVMAFRNEGEEVALTCKSIRETAGDRVDILALNDASDDGFDYKQSLKGYDVQYIESKERLGSSIGKQRCVEMCRTPCFLMLDAHCRMLTTDWLDKALEVMRKNEDCVYCCAVQFFYTQEELLDNKRAIAYGGWMKYDPKFIFCPAWNVRKIAETEFDIPCIQGANYLCSKRWWDYIGGHKGLRLYGREEAFVSKKSLMAGGSVKCIPQILTAHKGRSERMPYQLCSYEVVHNGMVIAYMLLDKKMYEKILLLLEKVRHPSVMRDARTLFASHLEELRQLKADFQKKVKVAYSDTDIYNRRFKK